MRRTSVDGSDRPSVGVARLRRALRGRRRPLCRARAGARSRRATRSTCSRRLVDENVKVRDDLLDVKELERVNRDGLEQWTPVLKAAFPIPRRRARGRARQAPREHTGAHAGRVHARGAPRRARPPERRSARRPASTSDGERYTIGGCMTELTSAADRRRETRTVAVESEDPGCRAGDPPRPRPGRPPERQLPPRPEGARGLRRPPVRGHRRRHELRQVPRRRACGRRHVAHGRRPRGRVRASARASTKRRARRGADRTDARRRSRAWSRRRAASASRRSPPSAPQGFGSRRTAPSSSMPVRDRSGIAIEVVRGEEEAGSPIWRSSRASGSRPARSWSSTPGAAARSSPSARRGASRSGSA